MTGTTTPYQLPYMTPTDSLHIVADNTKALAERLATLISSGVLTGDTGPANSLAIGSVTTAPAGSPASATITGTAPNQTLSLTLPRGDTGDTGPANSLAIGDVTTAPAGSPASATITGTAPNQTLSLTLPQGTGLDLIAGTVPTTAELPAASSVAAGTGYLVLSDPPHIWVSNGDVWADGGQLEGPPGPAPAITVTSVTTAPAGGAADATITGESPNLSLSLTIPRGDTGDPGVWIGTQAEYDALGTYDPARVYVIHD